jgi:hypothetical protein
MSLSSASQRLEQFAGRPYHGFLSSCAFISWSGGAKLVIRMLSHISPHEICVFIDVPPWLNITSAPGLLVQQFHRHVRASKLISCTRTRLWRSQRRLFVYSDSTTRGGRVPGGLIDAACIFQRLMLTFVACPFM